MANKTLSVYIALALLTLTLTGTACEVAESSNSCSETQTEQIGRASSLATLSSGAIAFEAGSTARMKSFHLYAMTPGVSRIDVALYEGGTSPESGIPLATSSITTGLGHAQLTWTEIPFPSEPTVHAGTKYYVVFYSTGNVQVGIGPGTGTRRSGGTLWMKSGLMWSENTSTEASLGATWDMGC